MTAKIFGKECREIDNTHKTPYEKYDSKLSLVNVLTCGVIGDGMKIDSEVIELSSSKQ